MLIKGIAKMQLIVYNFFMVIEHEKKGGASLGEFLQAEIVGKVDVLELKKKEVEKLDWTGQNSVQLISLTEEQIKIANPGFNEKTVKQVAHFHEANRLEAVAYKLSDAADMIVAQELTTAADIFRAQAKGYERASSQPDKIEGKARVNVLEIEKDKIKELDWTGQRSVQLISLTIEQIKIARPDLNENTVNQVAHFHEANRLETVAYRLDHPSDKVVVQKLTTAADIFRAQAKGYERVSRVSSPIIRK